MQKNKIKSGLVVSDTSCLIILKKIDALNLLAELYLDVITTPEIAKEYKIALPPWITIRTPDDISVQEEFNEHIDLGEASAIALSLEINPDFLLLDDLQARKFARKRGLRVKGTIGILLVAKQEGVISSLQKYLERIQETNFRLSPSLIEEILKRSE